MIEDTSKLEEAVVLNLHMYMKTMNLSSNPKKHCLITPEIEMMAKLLVREFSHTLKNLKGFTHLEEANSKFTSDLDKILNLAYI